MDAWPGGFLQRTPGAVNVALVGSGKGRDDGPADFRRDGLDGAEVALGGDGKPHLQDVHAEPVELAGHFEFLVPVHAAPG